MGGLKTELSTNDAMSMIKACHDDGEITINGRSYVIGPMNYKKRRDIYAYMTEVNELMSKGNMGFLRTPDWEKMEQKISGVILFEDSQLTKLPRHWDKYPEDYVLFFSTVMPVISYPFLPVSPTA